VIRAMFLKAVGPEILWPQLLAMTLLAVAMLVAGILRFRNRSTERRFCAMAQPIREAVAVFDDAETLEQAVFDLETKGFDRAAFSVLADEATVERALGHRYRRVEEMEDEPRAPRETFFTRISRLEAEYGIPVGLASIGFLALGATGGGLPALIAAGGGAVLGAALGSLIHHHHAQRIKEQLARGGILLWVNVRDAAQEKIAVATLQAHSSHDVHVHPIAA
jgi:hypothetical protein